MTEPAALDPPLDFACRTGATSNPKKPGHDPLAPLLTAGT
jgi:hypothetical protein